MKAKGKLEEKFFLQFLLFLLHEKNWFLQGKLYIFAQMEKQKIEKGNEDTSYMYNRRKVNFSLIFNFPAIPCDCLNAMKSLWTYAFEWLLFFNNSKAGGISVSAPVKT